MRARFSILLVAGALLFAGCSNAAATTTTFSLPALPGSPTAPEGEPLPELDAATISAGEELYAQSCASCHGPDLQGDPDWQVMKEDGSFPPPPQDSSGHTWHHGDDLLVEVILDGSEFQQSRMTAFAGQLTEAEILSIIEFFKSTWGLQERTLQWEVTLRERADAS